MHDQRQNGPQRGTFEVRDLELFAAVVDAGSITHGAERMHLALPSASARIRAMEAVIGTPLLVRERRGVTPTPAGRLLERHARAVLHQWDRMAGDLADYANGLVATVRLLANTGAVGLLSPDLLTEFLLAHPTIDVDLEESSSRAIVRAVADGRAELGLVADTVALGGLSTIRLRGDRLVLIGPPDRPVVESPVSFDDVLDLPFVGLGAGSALHEHLEGHSHPLGRRPHYRVRLPSLEAVCAAVSAGVGMSIVPEAAAERWQELHPTTHAHLGDDWANRTLVLCFSSTSPLSAPARVLADHLIDGLGTPNEPTGTAQNGGGGSLGTLVRQPHGRRQRAAW